MNRHPFEYVAPNLDSVNKIVEYRDLYKELHDKIMQLEMGRYRAIAITHLEESNAMINKHIVFTQE